MGRKPALVEPASVETTYQVLPWCAMEGSRTGVSVPVSGSSPARVAEAIASAVWAEGALAAAATWELVPGAAHALSSARTASVATATRSLSAFGR